MDNETAIDFLIKKVISTQTSIGLLVLDKFTYLGLLNQGLITKEDGKSFYKEIPVLYNTDTKACIQIL